MALEQAVQGALLVFLISAGSACSCIASLVPGLDKSPLSRTRQQLVLEELAAMFLHGCFLPALGVECVVPIGGTIGQGRIPCSSSAQMQFSPGALCLPLLALLPLLPIGISACCEAGASSWSCLPGSRSLAQKQGGRSVLPHWGSVECAMPCCAMPCCAMLCCLPIAQ